MAGSWLARLQNKSVNDLNDHLIVLTNITWPFSEIFLKAYEELFFKEILQRWVNWIQPTTDILYKYKLNELVGCRKLNVHMWLFLSASPNTNCSKQTQGEGSTVLKLLCRWSRTSYTFTFSVNNFTREGTRCHVYRQRKAVLFTYLNWSQ